MPFRNYEKFKESEDAASPLIGIILFVGLSVAMVLAILVMSVFTFTPPESASLINTPAKIEVVEVEVGLFNDTPPVNFNENWIIMDHKMGSPLDIAKTKIQIKGYGETQDNTFGNVGQSVRGDITIEYTNLGYDGKEAKSNRNNYPYSQDYHGYEFHNPDLSDGSWSPGERLTLNGEDSKSSGESSTVKVYMDGVTKTDNNWRINKSRQITVTVMDAATNQIIAVSQVKPV